MFSLLGLLLSDPPFRCGRQQQDTFYMSLLSKNLPDSFDDEHRATFIIPSFLWPSHPLPLCSSIQSPLLPPTAEAASSLKSSSGCKITRFCSILSIHYPDYVDGLSQEIASAKASCLHSSPLHVSNGSVGPIRTA